jgi:hypothetical protein
MARKEANHLLILVLEDVEDTRDGIEICSRQIVTPSILPEMRTML